MLSCVAAVWVLASTSAVDRVVRTVIHVGDRQVVIVHRAVVVLGKSVTVAIVRPAVETVIAVANAARVRRARLGRRVIEENGAIAVIVRRALVLVAIVRSVVNVPLVQVLVAIVPSVVNVQRAQVLAAIVPSVVNVQRAQVLVAIAPSVVIVRRVLVASVRSVQALAIVQRVRVLVIAASVRRVQASARIVASVAPVQSVVARLVVEAAVDAVRSAVANRVQQMNVVHLPIARLPSVPKRGVSGRHVAIA